ncbi:MAG: ribosome silencing factor [Comamonadaceae bacterium]|nr:ribosome silencing factor [Burkholderiales bacterium]MEB2347612.1 ribosome silencing factor [Comamonadaceae bacterium]
MTTAPTTDAAAKKSLTQLQRAVVDGLEDVKAVDIRVYDTEHLSPLFERVIVATGNSNRQTKALAASVRDAVRDAGFAKPRSEGEDNGEWIVVDCGAAVCHIMQPAIRQYYRLEEIWGEKPVRMKLGAAKPRSLTAPPDEGAAPARKPAAKKTARKAAPRTAAGKAAAKKAVARKAPAAKQAATPRKAPARKTAPVKTVRVNEPTTKKAAVRRTSAKQAPTRKASSRKA